MTWRSRIDAVDRAVFGPVVRFTDRNPRLSAGATLAVPLALCWGVDIHAFVSKHSTMELVGLSIAFLLVVGAAILWIRNFDVKRYSEQEQRRDEG